MPNSTRLMGLISGTSHDGIDVAVVDFTVEDDTLVGHIEHVDSVPYPDDLRARLAAALPPAEVGFAEVCKLDTEIGQAFADAARAAGPVDAICTHGQTVYHWIEDGAARGTLQIGQPAWLAEATGAPVISDVRAADLAAGGQGAPLAPLLDRLLLAGYVADGQTAAALNLGGIANLTVCAPGQDPLAWDTGPANALVDAVVAASADHPDTFDRDGRIAAAGSVVPGLLDQLLTEPYYALPAPKSSGKELFHHRYVTDALATAGVSPSLPDLVTTLTELTARTVADAITASGATTVLASGGGVHNPSLMARLTDLLPGVTLTPSDAVGVPGDAKEAIAFALIGWATMHGLPANVPSCTGASGARVLGRVSPAPLAAPIPARSPAPPTSPSVTPPRFAPLTSWPERLHIS